MYSLLQSPLQINRLTIPNRVFMPAMGTSLGAPYGGVTDDIIAYYERRARGGVGLIITEIARVTDGAGIGMPCQLACYRPSDVAGLERLADAVHKYGTRLFIQLQHPGREAVSLLTGVQPVAPSAIASAGGEAPRALLTGEVRTIVGQFVSAARLAQCAGADGVELHAAHGYLLAEFLSAASNRRTDEYGGALENRARIVTDILAGIRAICGDRFPVSVRINAEETPGLPGGITLEEAAHVAALLEKAGADAINLSCMRAGCIEPGTYAQGWKRYMAEAIRPAVRIPIMAVCHLKQPAEAEKLLATGAVDFVGVGRGQLADPDWCRKAFTGREDEIRVCIGCLSCFHELTQMRRAKCAVNPVMGRERECAALVRDGAERAVAVVGGGPAGVEAALTLRARGFRPVLFEASKRLGGALNVADKGLGKEKITLYTDALIRQVEVAGIETRLGAPATVEDVRALRPAGVFVACGAEPIIPDVPGADGRNVCTAEDVLLGRVCPQGRVVVAGGGMTGLETAETLAARGCAVTVVDVLDALGQGVSPIVLGDIMARMRPYSPTLLPGHALKAITPEGVELTKNSDGACVRVAAEHVVLALGVRPRRDVTERFQKAFPRARVVGDAGRGGRLLEATRDAYGQALAFEPDS